MVVEYSERRVALPIPPRPGLVKKEGWYEATCIGAESVPERSGAPRVRFTFLLQDGHLAWGWANITPDPRGKIHMWIRAMGKSELDPQELNGQRCMVQVVRDERFNLNRVEDVRPIPE